MARGSAIIRYHIADLNRYCLNLFIFDDTLEQTIRDSSMFTGGLVQCINFAADTVPYLWQVFNFPICPSPLTGEFSDLLSPILPNVDVLSDQITQEKSLVVDIDDQQISAKFYTFETSLPQAYNYLYNPMLILQSGKATAGRTYRKVSLNINIFSESYFDGEKLVNFGNTSSGRTPFSICRINITEFRALSGPTTYQCDLEYISGGSIPKDDKDIYLNYVPYVLDSDPYAPGGYNTPSGGSGLNPGSSGGLGGGGTFNGQSTPIPLPGLPSLSGIGSGFCGLFNPSAAQLNALARFMWSDDFVTNIVKLFGDPMDVILGLNIVPVKPSTSGSAEVTAGFISTGVSMPVVASQYAQVDCGSIDVKEYWGSCLDYSPYTQAQIFLPYIGTHQLDVDEIMDKTIHLIYNIDILSGSCVACLQCGDSTLYTFNGSCASSIPVTGQNFNTIISTAVQLAAGVGSFVASGGSMIGAAIGAGEGALTAAASGGMKPTVQHSGSVQATNGLLGIQTPYLIFTLPTQSVPENQNEYLGYPSNMTLLLSNCTGYTKCAEIHLVNIPATKPELDELESLLKRGVLI